MVQTHTLRFGVAIARSLSSARRRMIVLAVRSRSPRGRSRAKTRATVLEVLERYGVRAETDIPEGWAGLLDRLLFSAAALGWPAVTVCCDEQQSGGARFYLSHDPATYRAARTADRFGEMGDLIEVAEHRATATCEACGHPGRPRAGDGRVSILCDRHATAPRSVLRSATGASGRIVDGQARIEFPTEHLGANSGTRSGSVDGARMAAAARAGDGPTAVPVDATPSKEQWRGRRAASPAPSPPAKMAGWRDPEEDADLRRERPDVGYPGRGDRRLWDALADAPIPESLRDEVERMYGEWCDSRDSPEGGRYRTRLELISRFPRARTGSDVVDIRRVQAALDEDHWGIDDVKERVLEYCAVLARRTRLGRDTGGCAPSLLLVGPPGTGKSTIARSIARGLGRRFSSVALGGFGDAEALKGWGVGYRGARPGLISKTVIQGGVLDAVIRLDEIDKTGSARDRGDPNDALLEVLDPEQNHEFRDIFLEIPMDLSSILWIGTANSADIHPALLDRLEVIELRGYTPEEKSAILERHLLPKLLGRYALEGAVEVTGDALDALVAESDEAGVRQLDRRLSRLLGGAALELERGAARVVIDRDRVRRLAPPRRSAAIGFRTVGTPRPHPAGIARGGEDRRSEDVVM